MLLTAILLGLSAVFFWAGFKAAPHPLQYRSQAGFVVTLGVAGFAGYFAWRESRTLADLAGFIDPLPQITDVSYVPTAAEVAAVSGALARVPRSDRLGTTQEGGQQLPDELKERRTEYWLVKTALSSDSVLSFYRARAPHRGWTVEVDTPPWLILSQELGRMVLFLSDEFPRPGTRVLYSFTPVAGS